MHSPENEHESERARHDDEFARVLQTRDDIFVIEKKHGLRNVEAACLVACVITGMWITSMPVAPGGPRHHQEHIQEPALQEPLSNEPVTTGDGDRRFVTFRGNTFTPDFDAHRPKGTRKIREAQISGEQDRIVRNSLTGNRASESDSALIHEGNELRKRGDRKNAFAAFGRVLRRNPRNAGALAGMGDLYLADGLLDSAVASYSSAISVNPRIATAHNGLGSARYFISTLAANPQFTARRKILDPERFIRSQYDSAMAEYSTAISIDSSCVSALTNRGVLRDIRHDYEGAIKDYTLAIRINASFAEAFSKRAEAQKSLGNIKAAIDDYTSAIKLGSSSYEFDSTLHFANAYFGRGLLYYGTGDLDRAMADYDNALRLYPKHSLAILDRAIALSDKMQYDSAIAGYTQAISLLSPLDYNGAQGLAYLHRGSAYKAKHDYDRAIGDFKKAVESPRLAAKSCLRIAECYCLERDNENSMIWLRKAISNGLTDVNALKRDKDLDALRDNKAFQEITNR